MSGIAALSVSETTDGWTSGIVISCGNIGEKVDISMGGNYAMMEDVDFVISANGWIEFVSAASIDGARVEIGQIDSGFLTVRWTGVIASADLVGSEVHISCGPVSSLRHKEIPSKRINRSVFASMPDGVDAGIVPIAYGQNDRVALAKIPVEPSFLDCFYSFLDGGSIATHKTTFVTAYVSPYQIRVAISGYVTPATGPVPPDVVYPSTCWINESASVQQYIEVIDGAGKGQVRPIVARSLYPSSLTLNEAVVVVNESTPFDTALDQSSRVRIYSSASTSPLVAADEFSFSRVVSDVDGDEYAIAGSVKIDGAANVIDISKEFAIGKSYQAIRDIAGDVDPNRAWLKDGVSATGETVSCLPTMRVPGAPGRTVTVGDYLCKTVIHPPEIDLDKVVDNSALKVLYSFRSDDASIKSCIVHVKADRYTGDSDYINVVAPVVSETFSPGLINAYNTALRVDGEDGNYSLHAFPASSLPSPICGYKMISSWVTICERDGVGNSPRLFDSGWHGSVDYSGGTDTGAISTRFANGTRIRLVQKPYLSTSVDAYREYSPPIEITGTMWRTITGSVSDGGGNWIHSIDSAFPETTPSGSPGGYIFAPPSYFVGIEECESSVAIAYGDIPASSQFVAYLDSGREFSSAWASLPAGAANGDPIMIAPFAAVDLMYRDLGIPASDVDQAKFASLPSDPIHAVIDAAEQSADIYARLCEEFNWIGAHDSQGREIAKRWLNRVGTTGYDYTVLNADIISGSIYALESSAKEDLISIPSIKFSRTTTDGFRRLASIYGFTIPPDDMDSSNYLEHTYGFDDFAQAHQAYSVLYAAHTATGSSSSGEIQLSYSSDVQGLVIDSGRLKWAASRKPIITFAVLCSHAAAWADIGSRLRVTHRRYAPARIYGTLVARYWMPGSVSEPDRNRVQLTVMFDPR